MEKLICGPHTFLLFWILEGLYTNIINRMQRLVKPLQRLEEVRSEVANGMDGK